MPVTNYKGKDTDFRRIWAGIAFPGKQPGFLCAIGEQHRLVIHPHEEITKYRLIAEFESWDINELLNKVLLFKVDHQVSTFYGHCTRENNFAIDDFNERSRDLPWLDIKWPPAMDDQPDRGRIGYHIGCIQNLVKAGIFAKTELEGSVLRNYLLEIPNSNLNECTTDKRYPAVAALGYVLVALREFEPNCHVPEEDLIPDWL